MAGARLPSAASVRSVCCCRRYDAPRALRLPGVAGASKARAEARVGDQTGLRPSGAAAPGPRTHQGHEPRRSPPPKTCRRARALWCRLPRRRGSPGMLASGEYPAGAASRYPLGYSVQPVSTWSARVPASRASSAAAYGGRSRRDRGGRRGARAVLRAAPWHPPAHDDDTAPARPARRPHARGPRGRPGGRAAGGEPARHPERARPCPGAGAGRRRAPGCGSPRSPAPATPAPPACRAGRWPTWSPTCSRWSTRSAPTGSR